MIKKILFPTIAFVALIVAAFATPDQSRASSGCNNKTCPQWEDEGCDPWKGFHCTESGPTVSCRLCL